jgi:hypothetical protein
MSLDEQQATKAMGEALLLFAAVDKAVDAFRKKVDELPPEHSKLLLQLVGERASRLLAGNSPSAYANGTAVDAEEPEHRRKDQLDFAREILRPYPKGMHYRKIAIQALKLGCRYKANSYADGPIPEDVKRKFAHSINGAINKCKDFVNLGRGYFKLKGDIDQLPLTLRD